MPGDGGARGLGASDVDDDGGARGLGGASGGALGFWRGDGAGETELGTRSEGTLGIAATTTTAALVGSE